MDRIEFVGTARAGGYTGLVLQGDGDALCITAAADRASEEAVWCALDLKNAAPLANVQIMVHAARDLQRWALRMGAGHLVRLLAGVVDYCPQKVGDTANIDVDDRTYTITRLAYRTGIHVKCEDRDLVLVGALVRWRNEQRWLYLWGVTPPP